MAEENVHANRLIHETSPYLRQHAYQPVDWYPWGEEAFAEARRRNVPLMLSSGYSACHWCHVMARESFMDEETARLINENFVPVKVDREERPDIAQVYQTAVQAMTGQGGWPLTVFLTPEGEPFFGGTYFPPEPLYGRPSFRQVLTAVARAWQENPEELRATARRVAGAVAEIAVLPEAHPLEKGLPSEDPIERAATRLVDLADPRHGGFGRAPKFPHVPALMLLLRHGRLHGQSEPVDLALLSLRRMARGGIHDQLGGGFHRYSTDDRWLVPHFEKMLYDNAQLLSAYTAAYQITGDEEFGRGARGIVDYVAREMTAPDGGFFASQSAESEGVEGAFYLWTPEEVRQTLGDDHLYHTVRSFYGLKEEGNFAGKNVLTQVKETREIAFEQGRPVAEVAAELEKARQLLFAAREKRPKPFRDEKIVLAWNGMMISGLAGAARVFGDGNALGLAAEAAEFILARMADGPDHLFHVAKDNEAKIPAFLEDYASFTAGLLDLYETDFDPFWLRTARRYLETALADFKAPGGRYFESGRRGERLFTPIVSGFDRDVPGGAALHCRNLIRLSALTGEERFLREAESLLEAYGPEMAGHPLGCAALLEACEMYLRRPVVVAIVHPEEDPALLGRFRRSFIPYLVVAARRKEDEDLARHPARAVLAGKEPLEGRAAFYVCADFTCHPPQTDWPGLEAVLEASNRK
ncbi:MAG: thioredoxin domain-containing protein [Firmicutes bacterium]|nr:thioredoxin domain-containing protein [Bacillota bacterium]